MTEVKILKTLIPRSILNVGS